MIQIDHSQRGYYLKQDKFEKDYLTRKELLGYINLLNSNCSYVNISQPIY